MAWWIKTCLYFSEFMIPSNRIISPTPLAETQAQSMTDPPPGFTEGLKHSFLHLSPNLPLTDCWRLDPKMSNLDWSLHNTLFHWSSFQSLWASAYLSLFTLFPFQKLVFLVATLPQRPFLIKLLQTVELGIPVKLPDPEPGPCWTSSSLSLRRNSEKLRTFLGLPVLFSSLTSPHSSYFFITAWIPHLEYPVCKLISLWEWPCWCKILVLCLSNSATFGILNGRMRRLLCCFIGKERCPK